MLRYSSVICFHSLFRLLSNAFLVGVYLKCWCLTVLPPTCFLMFEITRSRRGSSWRERVDLGEDKKVFGACRELAVIQKTFPSLLREQLDSVFLLQSLPWVSHHVSSLLLQVRFRGLVQWYLDNPCQAGWCQVWQPTSIQLVVVPPHLACHRWQEI